jgi:hypothetical protein
MRVTIVIPDNMVNVDNGTFRTVDCSALATEGKHAVQWYDSYGMVEFKSGFDQERKIPTRAPNQYIEDFAPYQSYVDAYNIENAKQLLIEEAQQRAIAERLAQAKDTATKGAR